MPGKKMRSIKHPHAYESLRKKGHSKTSAAKIANSIPSKGSKGSKRKGR